MQWRLRVVDTVTGMVLKLVFDNAFRNAFLCVAQCDPTIGLLAV